jgi:hypothetical protein
VKVLQAIKINQEGNLRINQEGNLRINQEGNLRIKVEKRSNKVVGHSVVRHYLRLSNDAGRRKREYPNGRRKQNLEKWLFQERLPL